MTRPGAACRYANQAMTRYAVHVRRSRRNRVAGPVTEAWVGNEDRTGAEEREVEDLPAALGQAVGLGELLHVDADLRLAEPAGDLGDDVGVVVEGGRLDDRLGPRRRVPGLEDAGADEDAVRAELHHHRGVRGRGDAARGEQHDRQRARDGD